MLNVNESLNKAEEAKLNVFDGKRPERLDVNSPKSELNEAEEAANKVYFLEIKYEFEDENAAPITTTSEPFEKYEDALDVAKAVAYYVPYSFVTVFEHDDEKPEEDKSLWVSTELDKEEFEAEDEKAEDAEEATDAEDVDNEVEETEVEEDEVEDDEIEESIDCDESLNELTELFGFGKNKKDKENNSSKDEVRKVSIEIYDEHGSIVATFTTEEYPCKKTAEEQLRDKIRDGWNGILRQYRQSDSKYDWHYSRKSEPSTGRDTKYESISNIIYESLNKSEEAKLNTFDGKRPERLDVNSPKSELNEDEDFELYDDFVIDDIDKVELEDDDIFNVLDSKYESLDECSEIKESSTKDEIDAWLAANFNESCDKKNN